MTDLAVSVKPGSLTTYSYTGVSSPDYDQNKIGLGPCMIQANDSGNEGKWVGPQPIWVARPVETGLLVPNIMPDGVRWSTSASVGTYASKSLDWIVFADNAAASATRRFTLWTFNRATSGNPWSLAGSIVVTLPFQGTQGTYTNRGHEIIYATYTTGTVSITNGTTGLTGSTTAWNTTRQFIGSRIGFPATAGDPTTVPQWYEISAIGSDTSITLTQNFAQATLSGANYIIEDLRIVFTVVNGTTAANSGMFMVAGIRYENFTPGGFTISAATTTDKIRACYWLSDGNATSNTTIQAPGGIASEDFSSWTSQRVYMLNAPAGQSQFQVTNIRAAMTLTAGRDSAASTFLFNTGQQAVTGTVSTANCLILCTPGAGGGPRNGVQSLFWVTTTRIYSAITSGVTSTSTTFQSGVMVENPPGTSTTYALTAALNSMCYDNTSDRFLILTSGATSFPNYFTEYREDAGQINRLIMLQTRRTDQTTEDSSVAIFPISLLAVGYGTFLNGMCYFCTTGTSATTNLIYNIPLGADWEYATVSNSRIVFPVMSSVGFSQFIAGYANTVGVLGGTPNAATFGRTGTNLGQEPNAVRLYYRTSGISDNSGSWTLLDYSGDLSTVPASNSIQLMAEYRTATFTCLPGRITRVSVQGSGSAMDGHFQASQSLSSAASKQFSFRISDAFGGTIPTLYIYIKDGVTGSLLVSDNSVSQAAGTWEKSTNGGGAWGSYNSTDRANETTYIRFTPTSIADNVNALAYIALS